MPFARLRAALALMAVAGLACAAPVRTPNVLAELVAERSALVPGQRITVALRLEIRDGWHTYWRNPGDSGLPTTLAWKLPPGFAAGPIQWPAPHALPVGPLVNYGYEGEVLHLVDIDVPEGLPAGTSATLAARADWLVCRETCIPEGADLSLDLPVEPQAVADPRYGAAIAQARAALPKALAGWQASARGDGATIRVALVPPAGAADPGALRFFAHEEGLIEPSRPQPVARDGAAHVLTLPVASELSPGVQRLTGVITATADLGAPGVRSAIVDVPIEGTIVPGAKLPVAAAPSLDLRGAGAGAAADLTLPLAVALALAGGLLLNLMPCVFPVLSLKVLGFVEHHDARRTMRREALAFSFGVVTTFVLLGLALVALRAAGQELGWGFQLQSPAVVASLAMLFFVLAINLSGVFEFGMLAPSGLASFTARSRTLDAFASGVLAVIVASPCTAPLMGAALGYALLAPVATTLTVFAALGIGMALPYALLAWFPGWRRRLPRPGPWMKRVKELLAFPLYATVAWLMWVLGAQLDNDAVLRLGLALVLLAFGLWAWRAFRGGAARIFALAALIGVLGAGAIAMPLLMASPESAGVATASERGTDGWEAFSAARVAELATAGRPTFVDFTAAWCVTCQVNKRLVLSTAEVRRAFAARDVALLRADWTRRDPAITRALAELGRNGVPVYVLYRPGQQPMLLPEVLQANVVFDALATLGPAPGAPAIPGPLSVR